VQRLNDLLRDARRLLPALRQHPATSPLGGALEREVESALSDAVTRIEAIREATRDCFAALERLVREHAPDSGDYDRRLRLTRGLRSQPLWEEAEEAWLPLSHSLHSVEERLDRLTGLLTGQIDASLPAWQSLLEEMTAVCDTAAELRRHGDDLFDVPNPETIYWIEAGRGDSVALNAAPLHVGSLLQEKLFEKKEAVILTSATLAVQGSFAYLQGRLSLHDASTLALGSPFDYQRAALVYLPTDIPEPTQAGYAASVEAALIAAAEAANGRSLALFTSHSHLRAASRKLKAALPPQVSVLAQGLDGSADRLLAALRADQRTLLLGAASFWEGIDVVGEALSVLAICRLPFSVPDDPIFAARSEQFDEPFTRYALPQASLRLQQAFGRLIRSQTDRGILVMLDRRLTSKAYGKVLLDSLPGGRFLRRPLAELGKTIAEWLSG
jgi:Rad3-related DNA helicase